MAKKTKPQNQTAKIVAFPALKIVARPSDPPDATVLLLRELLADAERGKIRGFAFVALRLGEAPQMDITGTAMFDAETTLGALARLSYMLNSLIGASKR